MITIHSTYDNTTDNDRFEIFFKFVNETVSFSYKNVKTFQNFSEYDWLPKDNFKNLAYQVTFISQYIITNM